MLHFISWISSSFRGRAPWAVVLVALLLSPAGGMLYLGRGRNGILYAVLSGVAWASGYALADFGLKQIEAPVLSNLLSWPILVVGLPHCYFTARRLGGNVPRVWFARWYATVGLVFAAPVLAAILVRSFLWEPQKIAFQSMLPTLHIGDHFFISKFAYGYSRHSLPFSAPLILGHPFFREPKPGDVVVFKWLEADNANYIKRIVGLPNDKIQMIEGILHINGRPVLREPMADVSLADSTGKNVTALQFRETLSNGTSYPVLEIDISGYLDNTEVFEVPPGHYFVLGDNRDNSLDSRVRKFGFVPSEVLVGRLSVIFWNSEHQKLMWSSRD